MCEPNPSAYERDPRGSVIGPIRAEIAALLVGIIRFSYGVHGLSLWKTPTVATTVRSTSRGGVRRLNTEGNTLLATLHRHEYIAVFPQFLPLSIHMRCQGIGADAYWSLMNEPSANWQNNY